jgi:hypothetical protein
MFNWKKKEKVVEAPVERKDTVVEIDPFRLAVQSADTAQVQAAAMYPSVNDKIVDALEQSIARAERRNQGDHPFVDNLRNELVWRKKIQMAGRV